MAITKIGAKGADGIDGTSPTPGGDGGDVLYSYTGSTTINMTLNGGPGGDGGIYTGSQAGMQSAHGGNGGDATGLVVGNTFASAGTVNAIIVANGRTADVNGGDAGDADAEISGSNLITSDRVKNITWTATANAGRTNNGRIGNATASVTGNIIASDGPGFTAFSMTATADERTTFDFPGAIWTAAVTGNSLSGNLAGGIGADSEAPTGAATISGNTIDLSVPSGAFTMTAKGHSAVIDDNSITVAGQMLEIQLDPTSFWLTGTDLARGSAEFSGNSLQGGGQDSLDFDDQASFTPLTVSIDLADGTFLVDAHANSIAGFKDIALDGYTSGIVVGDSQDNVLTGAGDLLGGGGNDTLKGTTFLVGGKGNDTLTGGEGGTVAAFSGERWQYTFSGNNVTGPDGQDKLSNIEWHVFFGVADVTDFNDDGNGDLLFRNSIGQISISLMNGTAVQSHPTTGPVPSTTVEVIGTGDFDGDGKSDILSQNTSTGKLNIAFMNGASRVSGVSVDVPAGGTNWAVKAIGDFDRGLNEDYFYYSSLYYGRYGTSDIVLQNKVTGTVQIDLLGNDRVMSTVSVASPSGVGWNVIAAGDFNGDGFTDLLWQNTATNQLAIDLMQNTTVTQQMLLTGIKANVVATGDFNGDNQSDILWQNPTNGNVAIWFMDGGTVTNKSTIAQPPGGGWTVKGAEDINRDGKSDILWQNAAGQVYVSLISGSTVLSGSGLVTTPGAGWSLIATGGPSGG